MSSEPIGPVVVGVDDSPASRAAALLAADEAMVRVTPLVVVHVVDADDRSVRPERGRRLADSIAAEAAAEHPGLAVSARVLVGEPVRVLVCESRDACLLVVGHRRQAHRGRPGAGGGVAEQLVRLADVPVIVHQPLETAGQSTIPRPVLVGVDGEPRGEASVAFAFAEASLRGAPVLAMHVWSRPADAPPLETGLDIYDAMETGDQAAWLLSEAIGRWSDKYPDVDVRQVVRHSLDAPVALTAASRTAQLTVVGAGGSTAQVLLRRGGGPIAVVPGHD